MKGLHRPAPSSGAKQFVSRRHHVRPANHVQQVLSSAHSVGARRGRRERLFALCAQPDSAACTAAHGRSKRAASERSAHASDATPSLTGEPSGRRTTAGTVASTLPDLALGPEQPALRAGDRQPSHLECHVRGAGTAHGKSWGVLDGPEQSGARSRRGSQACQPRSARLRRGLLPRQ